MTSTKQAQQKQQNQQRAKSKKPESQVEIKPNLAQMLDAPETLRSDDVLAAQQQVGNQVVQRTLAKGKQDAAATDEHGNLRPELASKIQQKRGGGEALPEGVRKEAQKVLGKEFKNVRIHTDSTSDRLSRTVNARAFTIGSDIFFKSGVFAPGTSKGRETLMHELTHVVQQAGSGKSSGGKLKLGAPGTAMEKEADHIGKKHAQAKVGATASAFGTIQKAPLEEEELLQGQPEEEELQMQPDAGNVVQREEDEEELQMQPEEEELQMQSDAENVVQRVQDEDGLVGTRLNYPMYAKSIGSGMIGPRIKSRIDRFERKAMPRPSAPLTGKGGDKVAKGISEQVKKFGGSNKPIEGDAQKPDPIPKQKKTPPPLPKGPKPKLGTQTPKKPQPKISNVIPKAPELPKPKAKKEGPLSFSDQIKAKSKSMRTNSQRENLAKLDQDRQQKVGTRVSEQYMEDQANKPKSKMDKFKGFLSGMGGKLKKYGGMAGKAALGKVSGMVKGQLSEGKDHFLGKSEKKEEAASPSASPVTVNVGGGGGGGGGGGMAETISDLFQENKKLKAQIAELEKEKV